MRKFLKPFSFLPALMLMYLIYSFSAQEGEVSSALSYKVSYTVVKTADKVLDAGLEEWEMQSLATRFNGVTRKLAHMTEYFALAIAVAFPLYVYGLHGILLMLLAGLICVGFACGDEYHQSFVAGRGPSVRDVLIDSFGVFWGIILVRIIGWTGRKTIFRPIRKKKRRDDSCYEEERSSKKRAKRSRRDSDDDYYEASYDRSLRRPGSRQDDYDDYRGYAGRQDYYDEPRRHTSQQDYYEDSRRQAPSQDYYEDSRRQVPPRDDYENSYRKASQQNYYEDSRNHVRPQYYYASERSFDDDYDHIYSRREVEEAHVSDKLSEDMSFKKLMHDIKEQRKGNKTHTS